MAMLRQIKGEATTKLISGKMYFYKYEASSETEYYNKFPLIFMLRKRGGLFEGIDFHYLSLKQRIVLFTNMREFFSTKDRDITTKTRLFVTKFNTVMQKSKLFKSAKVAFKKYKKNNIKSKIIEINPTDWLISLKQPAEQFITEDGKKMSSMAVWTDSSFKQKK